MNAEKGRENNIFLQNRAYHRQKNAIFALCNYIVYFEYYSEGESGNDKYRFTSKTEALEQMAELKQAIKVNFCDSTETDTIEEPDFFGIMDLKSGDFAKVVLKEEIRN